MNKRLLIIVLGALVLGLLLIAVGAFMMTRKATAPTDTKTPANPPATQQKKGGGETDTQSKAFDNIKTPHFVSSEPTNNDLLTTAPTQVKINFNFDVALPSKIQVTREERGVTSGATSISANKLSLIVPVMIDQTGNYQVNYTACWPDGSCHEGSFGFSVKLP